jgi:hypothetical protein
MKTMLTGAVVTILIGMMTGCTLVSVPVEEDYEEVYVYDDCYIDSYLSIPHAVRELIYDHVAGYSTPPVSRYGYILYPEDLRDPDNLPSHVSADFNDDGYDDYAYMFSRVSWEHGEWFVKTRLLVVTSTYNGYELSLDLVLGTVSGPATLPVEEYWGIRLLESGTHTIETYVGNSVIEETVYLENDGIYLASLDPEERSVFYAEGNDVYEIVVDMGIVAKKRVVKSDSRADRVIKLEKSTLGKTQS